MRSTLVDLVNKKTMWISQLKSSDIICQTLKIIFLLSIQVSCDVGNISHKGDISRFDQNHDLVLTPGNNSVIGDVVINTTSNEADPVDQTESINRRLYQKGRYFLLKGWHIGVVVIISLVILVILYVMLAYDALPCKKKPEKETIPCYLCDTRVEKSKWNDGSHRRVCAVKKRANLERMAKPLEVHCPNCNTVLRLWPSNLGTGFHCDDSECRSPGNEIKNSGFNRLNCFLCDYDICMACANRKICKKQGIKPNAKGKLGTGLTTSAWMIHMNPLLQQPLRSRKTSSRSSSEVFMGSRKISKSKARKRSQKRSKSLRETRMRSMPFRTDSMEMQECPLINKGSVASVNSSQKSTPRPSKRRIPKITFRARSFEFDESRELHTVQVNVEFISENSNAIQNKEKCMELIRKASIDIIDQVRDV